jgi:hypothetical protein
VLRFVGEHDDVMDAIRVPSSVITSSAVAR